PQSGSGLRILIVDDNRDGADSLSKMLQLLGNDTRTAYDGLEAVDAAGNFRPDVVLLDIGMPQLNGYDACRHIRGQGWAENVVISGCPLAYRFETRLLHMIQHGAWYACFTEAGNHQRAGWKASNDAVGSDTRGCDCAAWRRLALLVKPRSSWRPEHESNVRPT